MLHLETGDEREGVPEDGLLSLAEKVASDPRLRLEGVATNFACFRGDAADIKTSAARVAQAARALREAGLAVTRVSGGNSSLLWLLARGERLPAEITELRCGEALLLGQDALFYEPLPGCRQDACVLRAEVLEEYTKPARPGGSDSGARGQGIGLRRRLVLGIGRQDLGTGSVKFLHPELHEVGRSADYMVVEVSGAEGDRLRPGSRLEMIPSYEALVAAWSSPFVEVRLAGR
jgi:predicted amino acid racemase